MTLAVAVLTWNLISGTLFILLPSEPVEEICVEDVVCLVPDNKVAVVMPWDGPPPVVKARSGSSWVYAVPWPSFTG
jgi:hypothetical protein